MRLPKGTEEEKAARKAARDKALLFAAEVPLKTAELATSLAALSDQAAPHINPNAASDLLVAVLFAQAALAGAAANVRINIDSLKSPEFGAKANQRLAGWTDEAARGVASIRARFPSLGQG
jgi:formiminotetrahydrofolate cyclodeaminase